MKEQIYIQEVGVRDGFQSEPLFISTDIKVALIDELSLTGISKIEVTAFVSPKAVPAMRDQFNNLIHFITKKQRA